MSRRAWISAALGIWGVVLQNGGCALATGPLVVTSFARPTTPQVDTGRLTVSTGVVYENDSITGGPRAALTGSAASLTLDLSPRYLLAIEGWGLSGGVEGDWILIDEPKFRLGLLHGVSMTFSLGNGCFSCVGARNDVGFLVDVGILLESDPDPKQAVVFAVRYAYRADLVPPTSSAQDVSATLGWSRRLGWVRLGPEIAVAGDLPPSLGGPPVQDTPSFAVVAGLSLGGDF